MSMKHEYVNDNRSAVICDTTIWYQEVPIDLKSSFILAATWLSVLELFKTSEERIGIIIKTWERLRDNSA